MKKQLLLSMALLGVLSVTGNAFGAFWRKKRVEAPAQLTVYVRFRQSNLTQQDRLTFPKESTIKDLRAQLAQSNSRPEIGIEIQPRHIIIYKENTNTKLGDGIRLQHFDEEGVRYYEYDIHSNH